MPERKRSVKHGLPVTVFQLGEDALKKKIVGQEEDSESHIL